MKLCKWCDNNFKPSVSYQVYCGQKCRDEATKEKILKRHQALKIKKRKGKDRRCKNCKEPLSIYTDGPLCDFCDIDPALVSKALKRLKRLGIIEYEQQS